MADLSILNNSQRVFIDSFIKSGHLVTSAREAWPDCDRVTQQNMAWKVLQFPEIKKEVLAAIAVQKSRLFWVKDQLLMSLVDDAFFDIGEAYNQHGKLLPISEMPLSVRQRIVSVRDTQYGQSIEFVNRQKAKDQLLSILGIGQETQGLSITINLGEQAKEVEQGSSRDLEIKL